MLALARVGVGVAVGEAGGAAPSMAMISDYYPQERRARAMSVYALGPQLGILFGLALGGWIAQHYGWRSAFLSMSVPGVLAALLLRWSAIEPVRGTWDAGKTAAGAVQEPLVDVLRDLWASKAFTRISLSALLLGFAGDGIGIWTPAFLVRSHGMSLQAAGAVMGLPGGLAAIVGTLASRCLKADGRQRPLLAGSVSTRQCREHDLRCQSSRQPKPAVGTVDELALPASSRRSRHRDGRQDRP